MRRLISAMALALFPTGACIAAEHDSIGYAWRVYGASEEVENRTWDPIDTMRTVFGAEIVKTRR